MPYPEEIMDEQTFRNTEVRYKEIKGKLDRGEADPEQVKAELKRLMVQDASGSYWMLGGKTGKWYVHRDNQWTEKDPYEELFPKQEEPPVEEEPALELGQFPADEKSEPVLETVDTSSANPFQDEAFQDGGAVQDAGAFQDAGAYRDAGTVQDAGAFQDAGAYQDAAAVQDDGAFQLTETYQETSPPDEAKTYQAIEAIPPSDSSQAAESHAVDDSYQNHNSYTTVDAPGGLDADQESSPFQTVDRVQSDDAFQQDDYQYQTAEQSRQKHVDFGGLDDQYAAGSGGAGFDEISLSSTEAPAGEAVNVQPVVDTRKFAAVEDEQQVMDQGNTEPVVQQDQGLFQQESQPFAQAQQDQISSQPQDLGMQEQQPAGQQEELFVSHTAPAEKPTLGDHLPCSACKSLIPPHAVYCSFCGANQKGLSQPQAAAEPGKKAKKSAKTTLEDGELLIKSIKITAFFFFLGGVGIFLGVIFGAVFGVIQDMLPEIHQQLPMMLQETRGQLTGGLIFAAIGGIGGFVAAAVLSLILSGIYNMISSIFGGIRFKVKQ